MTLDRDKKAKKCSIVFRSRPLGRVPRAAFFSGAVLGDGGLRPILRRWENHRAYCLVHTCDGFVC